MAKKKRTESYKALLGFTQEQLAMVLKVSYSLFAKYEHGTRNIPLASRQLLAEMLQYMCGPEPKTTGLEEQHSQKQIEIQRMLRENQYQQLSTTRKIENMEEKYATNIKALQLVQFLTLRDDKSDKDRAGILRHIAAKANKALKTHGLANLIKLKIKLELLQREKELLEAEVEMEGFRN